MIAAGKLKPTDATERYPGAIAYHLTPVCHISETLGQRKVSV